MELLAPTTFYTGILYDIPSMIRENHYDYRLYEPLLAFVLSGVLSSVMVVFYARRKTHHREVEADVNDMESKLLDVGFVYSVATFVLQIPLQLTIATLLRVGAFVFIDCFAGGLYIYKV